MGASNAVVVVVVVPIPSSLRGSWLGLLVPFYLFLMEDLEYIPDVFRLYVLPLLLLLLLLRERERSREFRKKMMSRILAGIISS